MTFYPVIFVNHRNITLKYISFSVENMLKMLNTRSNSTEFYIKFTYALPQESENTLFSTNSTAFSTLRIIIRLVIGFISKKRKLFSSAILSG